MEESIYNIIPKEYTPPAKEPLYKSKFPPNVKPTGSTFCNRTTSKPLVCTHLLRLPTSEESSQLDSRLTPSMEIQRLLATWKEIENLLPTVLSRSILELWATRPFLLVHLSLFSEELLLWLPKQKRCSSQGPWEAGAWIEIEQKFHRDERHREHSLDCQKEGGRSWLAQEEGLRPHSWLPRPHQREHPERIQNDSKPPHAEFGG